MRTVPRESGRRLPSEDTSKARILSLANAVRGLGAPLSSGPLLTFWNRLCEPSLIKSSGGAVFLLSGLPEYVWGQTVSGQILDHGVNQFRGIEIADRVREELSPSAALFAMQGWSRSSDPGVYGRCVNNETSGDWVGIVLVTSTLGYDSTGSRARDYPAIDLEHQH